MIIVLSGIAGIIVGGAAFLVVNKARQAHIIFKFHEYDELD